MAKIKRVNHIAIAVHDIEGALAFWRDALGLALQTIEEVPSQKSTVAFIPVGESEIELVQPTSDESGLAQSLQKRGPGLHHLCLEVDDLDQMLVELKAKGIRLVNQTPEILPGRKMAFIHPQSANGVLVELYELTL